MLLGARQFFAARKAVPLPYDAEVEYLEITRYDSGVIGPYIDTGVVVRPTDKVSVDWQGLSTWANDLKFFGSYFGYGWASFYGGVWRPVIGNFASSSATRDTNRHSIVFENYTCNLDGVAISSGSGNFSNISFYLFTMNGQSLTSARLEQRVYSLSIERSGEKVLDMIPVRFTNELDLSEGAMYDLLGVGGMNPDGSPRTDGLYRNRGTGAFLWAEKQ
jgi:hypothetical protein